MAECRSRIISAIFIAAMGGLFANARVFANEGDGSGSSGVPAACSSPHAYQGLCADGKEGGGASWHIYKTTGTGAYAGPSYVETSSNILTEKITIDDIKSKCPASTYNYYVAFGWDGLKASGYTHYGPAKRESTDLISESKGTSYNNYGAWDYATTAAAIENNTIASGQRLQKGVAEQLYSDSTNGGSLGDSTGYFCFAGKRTLTGYAVTDYRSSDGAHKFLTTSGTETGWKTSAPSNAKKLTKTVNSGSSASVNFGDFNPTGYSFSHWGSSCPEGSRNGAKCTINPLNEDKNVYIYYVMDQYKGRSRAMAGSTEKASTGYVQSNGKVIYQVPNCSTSGCTASIQHHLKRTAGSHSTTYSISRVQSNISGKGTGILKNITTENFSSGSEVKELETSYTLHPGEIVCETMTFKANKNATSVQTTACISANGSDLTPDGAINIDVKNASVNAYASYQKSVYAKPGDSLTYRGTYNPFGDQIFYSYTPEKYTINGGSTSPGGLTTNSTQLGSISAIGWKNAFNMNISFGTSWAQSYTYNKGDTSRKVQTKEHSVLATEAGSRFVGNAELNNVSAVKNTPTDVYFDTYETKQSRDCGEGETAPCYDYYYFSRGNVTARAMKDTAYTYVPHNFENSTSVETNHTNLTVYAGETAEFKYKYIINPRANSYTTNSSDVKYATTVYNPKWKLELCITGGGCYETSVKTQSTHDISIAEMYRTKEFAKSTTISIPDVAAGTEICVRSAVYPSSSGAATNWSDGEGSHAWAYSGRECFIVAKKPSIQILGGNVYSNGKITTSDTAKTHLGLASYDINKTSISNVFGSWGELGVLANGDVSGFASAAALGYSLGSTKTGLVNHAQMSFGNYPANGTTGKLGSTIMNSEMSGDSDGILKKFDYGDTNEVSTVILNDASKVKEQSYYYHGADVVIPAAEVAVGTIQFVHARNIAITGDLKYPSTSTMQKIGDVPKLILYAEKDVNISCDVAAVDALIIAGGTVRTCADASGTVPGVDDSARSRQLTIRGAVMAAKISADRTYGAATGANSIVPAEIINFDPTLYRFGEAKLSETEEGDMAEETSVDLNTVYLRELAPRL